LDSSKIKIFDCHQELKPDKKVLEIGSAQDLANPFGSGFAGPKSKNKHLDDSNLRILSEPEHAPDFSPRVLDNSNFRILDMLRRSFAAIVNQNGFGDDNLQVFFYILKKFFFVNSALYSMNLFFVFEENHCGNRHNLESLC